MTQPAPSSDSASRLCPRCGAHGSTPLCNACGIATIARPGGDDDLDSLVGATLAERYAVTNVLGHGGMGTVYGGVEIAAERAVAIKVMRSDVSMDAAAVERFKREARLSSQLDHPNIIRQYDFGVTSEGLMYLVMELLTGRELADEIAASKTLTVPRALGVCGQVAQALQLAHAHGIVHRDLKPGNIFMAEAADGSEVAKVMDFGIAKSLDDGAPQVTQAGVLVGTPAYMSPEQAKGGKLTATSDIYALGIILFEMLTGAVPFDSDSLVGVLMMQLSRQPTPLREMRPDLAANTELQALLDTMLDKAADRRPDAATTVSRLAELARAAPKPAMVVAAGEGAADEATAFMEAMAEPQPVATIQVGEGAGEDEATAFVDAVVDPGPVAQVQVDAASEDEATAFVDAMPGPAATVYSGQQVGADEATAFVDAMPAPAVVRARPLTERRPARRAPQAPPVAIAPADAGTVTAQAAAAATATAVPAQVATVVAVPAVGGDVSTRASAAKGAPVLVIVAALTLVLVVGAAVGVWLLLGNSGQRPDAVAGAPTEVLPADEPPVSEQPAAVAPEPAPAGAEAAQEEARSPPEEEGQRRARHDDGLRSCGR